MGDKMNKCYIFGSMPVEKLNHIIDEDDLVIAADNGLKNTEKFSLTPHYIVGDFDSLGYIPEGSNIIKHPIMKNETDTILAIDVGFREGYRDFIIYGCLGGRLDHTIGSLQTALYIARKGGTCLLVDDTTYATVIRNTAISFTADCKGTISVFSYSDTAYGVTEKGLLYSLTNETLTSSFPLGVSNEFTGNDATISVKDGTLLVIWQTETGNYIIGG